MRKWRYTLAARIIAGVLFMILAMGTLLGAGACVALYQYNAFNDEGKELFDNAAWYLMSREAYTVRQSLVGHFTEAGKQQTSDSEPSASQPIQVWELALPNSLQANRTNFRFYVRGEDVFMTNGELSNCFAYREEPWTINTYGETQRLIQEYPTEEEADRAASRLRDENRDGYASISIRNTETGWQVSAYYQVMNQHMVTASYGVDASLPVFDRYSVGLTAVNTLIVCRNWAIPLTALCLVFTIALFIFLLVSAGHRFGTSEVTCNWFDRMPLELVILGMGLVVGGSMEVLTDRFLVVVGLFLPMLLALGLLFCMTFAVRCKTRTLVKGTLLYWVCRWAWAGVKWLGYVLKNLPLIWKTILVWGGVSFIELVVMMNSYIRGPLAVFWLLEKLVLTAALFAFVIGLKKLQAGAERLAAGDMTPVDERHLTPEQRKHARSLNSIGRGMDAAVARQMKSERMKTELITNVSHDLKTPLTSLISYVDLLKREGLTSERAPEYLDVLDRQSQRLKKLTEDLVEASKASTGNIQAKLEDGREPAPLPGGGGVQRAAGGGKPDAGDHPGHSGAPHPGRRATPVAGVRQPALQCHQVRPARHPGLPHHGGEGREGVRHLPERVPGAPEYLRRGAYGAVRPRRRLPEHRGQRPGPLHRPQPYGAQRRVVGVDGGRGSVQSRVGF